MSEVWIKQKKRGGSGSKSKKPFVTISNKNATKIYLSSKTMQELLNNNKHVKIGVDNIKKRMYIKQTTVNDVNAMKVKKSTESKAGVINSTKVAEKLTNVAGIKKNDTQRYELKELKNGLYYADFTEPMDDMKGEVLNDWRP